MPEKTLGDGMEIVECLERRLVERRFVDVVSRLTREARVGCGRGAAGEIIRHLVIVDDGQARGERARSATALSPSRADRTSS